MSSILAHLGAIGLYPGTNVLNYALSWLNWVQLCSTVLNWAQVCSIVLNCAQLYSTVLNWAQLCSTGLNCAQLFSTELKYCPTGHFREYEEHEHEDEQKPFLEAHRSASA